MTISKWWVISVGVTLLLFVSFGSYAWLAEHDAKLNATAQTAALQKTNDQAKADAAQTAAQLKQTLAGMETQKAQPATAQRIAASASNWIPNLPQPIEIAAAPRPAAGTGPALPDSPAAEQLVVPEADFQVIQTAAINCQEDVAKLSACIEMNLDLQTQVAATTAQRDEWEKTAKGGTWIHRAVTAAKWTAAGVVAGYVAGHKW